MKYIDDSLETKDFLVNGKADKKTDSFLITRFNLHLWGKDKHNRKTLSDEWTEERFELFERYCFPSVLNQTDKNFFWLCLFDISTLRNYENRITAYKKRCPGFVPLFLDDTETSEYASLITQTIKHFKNDNNLLITMRLDNDDALNLDYVSRVRHCTDGLSEDVAILSFKYGIQYYAKEQIAVRIPFHNNHFLALIDKKYDNGGGTNRRKIQHVLQFNHFNSKDYPYPFVCNKKDRDMWIEVIHETNVSNDCKMTFSQSAVTDRDFLTDRFGLEISLPQMSQAKFWTFMLPRFVKHVGMKLSSKF